MSGLFTVVRNYCQKENVKPAVVLLYTILALTLWKYLPCPERLADTDGTRILPEGISVTWLEYLWGARKMFSAFLLMGLIPVLIVRFGFRESLADYGLQWGIVKRTVRTLLIMAPIMIVVGWLTGGNLQFYQVYPYNPFAGLSYGALTAHLIIYLLFYYFAWEFFFRGFMLHGLKNSCGLVNAILIQTMASVMLHFGHPGVEIFGCILGSLFWGFLVVRTRSILSGALQHAILGIMVDTVLVMNLMNSGV